MRSLVFPRSVLAFAEAREQAALQIPDIRLQSKPLATIYLWISLSDHFLVESAPGKKSKELLVHSGVSSDDRVCSWLPLVLCGGARGSRPIPPSPASMGVKLFRFCSRTCSQPRKHRDGSRIHGASFFRVQHRARIALPNL